MSILERETVNKAIAIRSNYNMNDDRPAPRPRANNRLWQLAADGLLTSRDFTKSGHLAMPSSSLTVLPYQRTADTLSDDCIEESINISKYSFDDDTVQGFINQIKTLQQQIDLQRQYILRMERVTKAFFTVHNHHLHTAPTCCTRMRDCAGSCLYCTSKDTVLLKVRSAPQLNHQSHV